jgi:hypothetical protein
VQQHVHVAGKLFPGPSAPAEAGCAFAATQAAWRFLHNERVTWPRLIEPLQQVARQWRHQSSDWAVVVHDWSVLSYPTHRRKTDRLRLGPEHSLGYELTTVLLVDGGNGIPVAPLAMSLRAAQAVYSTRTPVPASDAGHRDEILPAMQEVARLGLGEHVVHVLDREADALAYYRQWHTGGCCFLIRAEAQRTVRWQGEEVPFLVLVWELERAPAAEASSFREFLVRLSGRQMKRGKPHTAPALLAGLYVYLAMLDVLEQHSVEELRAMQQQLRFTKPDTG